MNWAYNVTPSAFRRRGICSCGFTTLMSVAAKRHNSLKSFLLSASLVATQLCWLIVVFLLSSFAWSLSRPCSRDWMHTNLYLWLIVVLLRYHCFCILIQLNYVVQVEPKVLAAVGHDRRCSRWSHYHLCSSDNGVHRSCRFALRRRWSLVSQMSWSISDSGSFPRRLSHSQVRSRQRFAVPPRFTRSIQAATVGWLDHGWLAHVDGIETAAAYRARVFDPVSCSPRHWRGLFMVVLQTQVWYQSVLSTSPLSRRRRLRAY